MFKKYLQDQIIREEDNVYYASWKLSRSNATLIVVDQEGKYKGVLGFPEIERSFRDTSLKLVKDIYNSKGSFLYNDEDIYCNGRNLFGEKEIYYVPVIDREREVIDLFSHRRAFYKKYYKEGNLPRMHYAACIYNAASEAFSLGYKAISVIEFGVAGGNGLINCEFHAREIGRLFGIDIQIYGFDSGSGLPHNLEPDKEYSYFFTEGDYNNLRLQELKDRLRSAKLIIGDIRETTQTFLDEYQPAPIGVMLIDVDYYISTVPILNMLLEEDRYFIPRVWMYFDDINFMVDGDITNPCQGEALAIQEFNLLNRDVQIAPGVENTFWNNGRNNYLTNVKVAFKFKHPLFSKPKNFDRNLYYKSVIY